MPRRRNPIPPVLGGAMEADVLVNAELLQREAKQEERLTELEDHIVRLEARVQELELAVTKPRPMSPPSSDRRRRAPGGQGSPGSGGEGYVTSQPDTG